MVCPEETVTPEQARACEQPRTPRAPFEVRMAVGDERVMRRPAAYLPSSMLAWRRLLAVGASFHALTLLLLLLIGSCAAQASDATTLPADVIFTPDILLVRVGDRRLSVPLRPKRAAVESYPGGVFSVTNCTYEGRVYEQGARTTGRAVVTACPGELQVHALIISPSGEALSVGPSQSSDDVNVRQDEGVGGSAHVVRREAATSKLLTSWTKPSTRRRRATKAAATSRERAIELAVFVDAALVDSMPTERALNTRLTAVLEQVQLVLEYRSLSRPVKLDIVNLEMVDSKRGPSTANGDIDTYLDNFCVWQCNRKQQAAKQGLGTWDHAMMLSGLDLHKGTNKRVLGLAWVNGMCRCRYSCTLSEARSLEAALVVAHELGHSLGMRHDGPPDNRCDPDRYIMSAQTGAGKTSWSVCSGQYLEDFLSSRTSSCLQSRSSQTVAELDGQPLPGQLYPADAQCKLALGSDYSVYTSSRSPFNDVCKELWCLEGSYASPAHPALDGTACAKGKHCREGSCVVAPAGQESDGAVSSTRKVTRSTTTTTTTAAVPATPPRRSTFDVITNIWNRFFSGFPRWF